MKKNYNVSIEIVGHEKGIIYNEDMTILFKTECKVNNELKEPNKKLIGHIAVDYNKRFNNIIDGNYNWSL